jgi:hypothetical protein
MSADSQVAGEAVRLAEQAHQVALCLDFDGTLSPIVEDPEAARPPHWLEAGRIPVVDSLEVVHGTGTLAPPTDAPGHDRPRRHRDLGGP